jgi:hypothetical protein
MPERCASRAGGTPTRYRIVVRGAIGDRLLRLFGAVSVEDAGYSTILTCDVIDQARLQAILSWLHDDGVEILSAEALENGA